MREYLNHARRWLRNAPPRVRILTGLTGLLFLAVLVNAAVTGWLAYGARLDEAVEMRTLEFQRLSRNVAGGDDIARLHAEISSLQDDVISSRLVKAGTPPLSEAMFQHIVNEWAERSRVSILSLRMLPRMDRDDFSVIRMAINCRAEIGGIQNFLGQVRQSPRLVFFDEVEIKNIGANERRYYYFNAQLSAWTIVDERLGASLPGDG